MVVCWELVIDPNHENKKKHINPKSDQIYKVVEWLCIIEDCECVGLRLRLDSGPQ